MFRRGIKGALIFFVALLDTLVFVPVYLITVLLLRPWRNILPKMYWTFESCIFRELMYTAAYWSWLSGVKILEFGDNPEDYVAERCLVTVNHQSTADVLTLMAAFCQKFPCGGQILWIQDIMFRWTHFGIVSQLHGDFFIEQGRAKRQLQSERLRSHLERKYWSRGRNWIILFPEGGFLRKRIDASRQYAEKNNFPVLNNVTLPRVGAIKTVLDTCLSYKVEDEFDRQVRFLIDVTIIYENGKKPLNVLDFTTGLSAPTTIRVVYKARSAALIPVDEQPLVARMYSIWQEKEQLIEGFNTTGQIPDMPDSAGRILTLSYNRFFLQRIVFYALAYFYYKGFMMLWSTVF